MRSSFIAKAAALLLLAGCGGEPEVGGAGMNAEAPAVEGGAAAGEVRGDGGDDGTAVRDPLDTAEGGPAPVPPRSAPPAGVGDSAAGESDAGAATPPRVEEPPAQPPPARDAADAAGSGWTAGIVDRPGDGRGVATLRQVRTARHDGYDRVVFEFAPGPLPGYHLEYIDRPVRECGSGDVVRLAGDGWLEVRMEPARAHDDEGRATVRDRARAPGLPIVLELRSTCDFEAVATWVLGVASPNRYRVLELRDPARLVVDVRH